MSSVMDVLYSGGMLLGFLEVDGERNAGGRWHGSGVDVVGDDF